MPMDLGGVIFCSEKGPLPTPKAGRESLDGPPFLTVSSGEVIGLLNYLDARGGTEEVLEIVSYVGDSGRRVIPAIKCAVLLGFVCALGRLVVLESEGRRFLQAAPPERARMWRKRLLRWRCFREVHDALRMPPNRRIDREAVLQILARCVPGRHVRFFQAFVDWARRGALFAYDDNTRLFSL